MKKSKKLSLEELKLKSFVTDFKNKASHTIHGGDIIDITYAGQGCATQLTGCSNDYSNNCDYSQRCQEPTRAGEATCDGWSTGPAEHPSFYC